METITASELQVWSEITVSYKPKVKPSSRPQITSSNEAYNIFKIAFEANMEYCEEFRVMLLNSGNRVIGVQIISLGGINSTAVDIRKILQTALKANAVSIILAHNHPSGQLTPSSADLKLTNKIVEAADIMDIKIFDHLIVTSDSYYSFADNGTLNAY